MKKILFTLFIALIASGATMAQQTERGNKGGGQMREMLKERLKSELQLTDAQTDSVLVIQQDFQVKSRDIRMSENLSEDDKRTKMSQVDHERKTKLKNMLSEEQLNKLDSFYENLRKMREQRGQGSNRD